MPGRLDALSVPAELGQPDRRKEGIDRAGLAGRAHAPDRTCPEHAELMATAGVMSLDGMSLPGEEGVELPCSRGVRQNLEVPDENALERLGVRVNPVRAAAALTGLC